jgi:hypothetical protein
MGDREWRYYVQYMGDIRIPNTISKYKPKGKQKADAHS